jgi:type I restriction enzyme S subunit
MYGEGKTRGHCSELLIDAATNQACAAISRIDASVDRRYLKLFFATEYEANRRLSAGGVQPNLSLSLIKEMRFPCPPRAEQEAIVETVENELAAVERMASSAAATIQSGSALRRSILATAFRGQLVPQHPDDEPASVLLERIAAERASAPKPARKRRERAKA